MTFTDNRTIRSIWSCWGGNLCSPPLLAGKQSPAVQLAKSSFPAELRLLALSSATWVVILTSLLFCWELVLVLSILWTLGCGYRNGNSNSYDCLFSLVIWVFQPTFCQWWETSSEPGPGPIVRMTDMFLFLLFLFVCLFVCCLLPLLIPECNIPPLCPRGGGGGCHVADCVGQKLFTNICKNSLINYATLPTANMIDLWGVGEVFRWRGIPWFPQLIC